MEQILRELTVKDKETNLGETVVLPINKENVSPIMCKHGCGRSAVLGKDGAIVHGSCGFCQAKTITEAKIIKKAELKKELTITFIDRPEVLERLKDLALSYVRTIEEQALWYVVQGVKQAQ